MRQATTISNSDRQRFGLPDLAGMDDYAFSLEVTGEVTDHHKALASKLFNVPYAQVTDQQRKVAKTANFWGAYQ